jgi:outer membrane protein TolC
MAHEVRQEFEAAIAPQPGGLRADEVARKAEATSPDVLAKQKAVEAAAAKVDQAALLYVPKFSLLARYVRLSDIEQGSLGSGGSIVGTTNPPGQPLPVICNPPGSNNCFVPAVGVDLTFPVLLNMWTLQGSVAIPLSDYLLRISHNHASATRSRRAAELQALAARLNAQSGARVAFYNWVRAKGGLIVAEEGLQTANAHLRDVQVAAQVGSASKADVLAVEGAVANTELLVESTRNLVALSEEQLRVMMHDPPGKTYRIGENVSAAMPPAPPVQLPALFDEAMRQRLELKAIDESIAAAREGRKTASAGRYPRLDAFGDLYHQNPNTRVFPQEEKWTTSWDVGVQLSWTINDTLTTGAQLDEIDAKILEARAQRAQLEDGIRLQVTKAYSDLRVAQMARGTTERELVAAEEGHRVRRELFRAGRATSTELRVAEQDLIRARLNALNARIDVLVAHTTLDHALGRDAARR